MIIFDNTKYKTIPFSRNKSVSIKIYLKKKENCFKNLHKSIDHLITSLIDYDKIITD